MRYAIGIFVLILAAIGIAAYTSRVHPGDIESLPSQRNEEFNAQMAAANAASAHGAAKAKAADPKAFDSVKDGALQAKLLIENRGAIVIELYPKAAPQTVAHIVALIKKGFYNGIKVHRVEPNLVAQMGDPETKNANAADFQSLGVGSHGSGSTVPLETNAGLPNILYSVGLARSSSPGSGDSQFYINLGDNTSSFDHSSTNPGYCVFGRVIQGADVAPKLQIGDKITSFTVNAR